MKKIIFFLLPFVFLFKTTVAQSPSSKKCRALVLEGGGDLGSYEAGVIKGFIDNLPAEEVQYDVITGISVGSVNAGGMGQFAKGDEKNMIDFLLNVWLNVTASDIYQNWPYGIIEGLLYKSSLYDASPESDFLSNNLKQTIKRRISIGATDISTGELIRYDGETLNRTDLIQAIRASSAIPVAFPYIKFDNRTFMDGGVEAFSDYTAAVDRCREVVDDDKDIIIDSVFCFGFNLSGFDPDNQKTLGMLWRFMQIESNKLLLGDLLHTHNDFPDVNFRYTVIPNKILPSLIPINFNHKQIEEMIQMGIEDAKEVIGKGEGVSHQKLISKAKQKYSFRGAKSSKIVK
jgi:hypothetical protein